MVEQKGAETITEVKAATRVDEKAADRSSAASTDAQIPPKGELLDDEGDLSAAFTTALEEIFVRFSQSAQEHVKKSSDSTSHCLRGVEKQVILMDAELDEFAKAVNEGEVLDTASKEEMKEYLDVDRGGNLTVSGISSILRCDVWSMPLPCPSLPAFVRCIICKAGMMRTRHGRTSKRWASKS